MTLKYFLLLIWLHLRACVAVNDSCSESQCRLLVNESGVPIHDQFQSKASEKNVRMVYLNLRIGNNTYKPLDSEDKFLPMRWVWARSSAEHMLSLSYDYDILSLGLLNYQKRNMDVNLIEEPSGCLANLTSSCRDIVAARTLLGDVTRESSTQPSLEPEVVCVAVTLKAENFIDWYRDLFEGNVEFQCCQTEKLVNKTLVHCGLDVKNSEWLTAFYAVLNTVTFVMMFFWPLLLLVLPDFCFNFRKENDAGDKLDPSSKSRAVETGEVLTEVTVNTTAVNDGKESDAEVQLELSSVNPAVEIELSTNSGQNESTAGDAVDLSSENRPRPVETKKVPIEMIVDKIAVDDVSPFTCSDFVRTFAKNFPHTSNYFKLFLLWFLLIPMVFYITSVLNITMKRRYLDETSRKQGAYVQGLLFSVLFDIIIRSYVVLVPLIIVFVLFPGFIMYLVAPSMEEKTITECYICKKTLHFRNNMIEHLKMFSNKMYDLTPNWSIFKVFKEYGPYSISKKCCFCIHPRPQNCTIKHFICEVIAMPVAAPIYCLLLVIYSTLCGIFCAYLLLKFILFSGYYLIFCYSPFVCFLILIVQFVGRAWPCCVAKQWRSICSGCFSFVWLACVSLIASLCCRFVVRMFGFVIMGFIFNVKQTAPLLSFAFVLVNNIHMCYSNVQERYKEVKEMISEQWKEEGNSLPNADVSSDTIPSDLFFYVCNDPTHGVLPIAGEVCYMLLTIAVISTSLFFALAAITFSDQTFDSSPLISVIAVFISGKIPELFFKGLMKETKFTGKGRINKKEAVKEAVIRFIVKRKKEEDNLEGVRCVVVEVGES